MAINNITISAVPTVYPAFLERVALSTSALQLFANRACLLDSSGNVVGGTEIQADSQSSVKALLMSHVGSVVTVSYLNNFPSATASKLRVFHYDSATGVVVPLIDFEFEFPVTTPSWGLYSFSFNINFSIV